MNGSNGTMKTAEEFYKNADPPYPGTFDGYFRSEVMFEFAESYAKERERVTSLAFQKHMDELYGIGGFEEDDKKEFDKWHDTFINNA